MQAATGASVDLLPWQEALSRRPDASLVFSMCQGVAALCGLGVLALPAEPALATEPAEVRP